MLETVFVNCHILFTMYSVFQFIFCFLLPEWRNKVEYINNLISAALTVTHELPYNLGENSQIVYP
jgi:hypothetical protein